MRRETMRRKESMPVLKGVVTEILFAVALGIIGIIICTVIVSIAG